jgi:hypothetical protein
MNRLIVWALFLFVALSNPVQADVCDYRPSNLVGKGTTATVGGAAGATAAAGASMNALGFYTIVHSTSGAVMLGSTAAGASAAGTTGIIAGTAGIIGTVGAAIMSPFVIIPAAAVAVGIGAYEGACHFVGGKEPSLAQDVEDGSGSEEEVSREEPNL